MPYQHKREPLSHEETDRLANAAESFQEKLVIFILLDTGLRVSELASLTKDNIQWQERRLTIYGKGGIYGTKTKLRVVPVEHSIRAWRVLEHHFSIENTLRISVRTVQNIVKRVANRAHISKPVSPHVLRHTFSVNALKKGISLVSLQRVLGHDRIETTMIYLNLSPEDVVSEFKAKW